MDCPSKSYPDYSPDIFHHTQQNSQAAVRIGRKNVTVFSMAMANVTGNPKRTIGTILTLGLSCALFVIISNYVGNIDTEHEARLSVNHGQFELQLDYSAEYDERKTHCDDSTNSSFGITRYICHCHRKHGDIFSAISFSFFLCFYIF